jgi:hypothetical protein
MNIPQTEVKSEQKGIKNFFGNLLDRVNAPPVQISLSNKPIEDDFKTDMVLFCSSIGFYKISRPKDHGITFGLCEKLDCRTTDARSL